jgi:hypothetical protein
LTMAHTKFAPEIISLDQEKGRDGSRDALFYAWCSEGSTVWIIIDSICWGLEKRHSQCR